MRLEPLDQTQIESIVSKAIEDAVDFIEAEISPEGSNHKDILMVK